MKDLLNYLKGELGSEFSEVTVKDARIGLVYTGVLLSSGHAGVAYTPLYELSRCPALTSNVNIAGRSALNLMKMILSPNLVEVAVGVATANALSQIIFEMNTEKGGISFFPLENLSQRYEKSNRGSKRNVEKKPT